MNSTLNLFQKIYRFEQLGTFLFNSIHLLQNKINFAKELRQPITEKTQKILGVIWFPVLSSDVSSMLFPLLVYIKITCKHFAIPCRYIWLELCSKANAYLSFRPAGVFINEW